VREFGLLCLDALNKNASSLNYLLDFCNTHSSKFILTTISLSQPNDQSIIKSIPIQTRTKIHGYINDQDLTLVAVSAALSISPTCYIKSLFLVTVLYWIHQHQYS